VQFARPNRAAALLCLGALCGCFFALFGAADQIIQFHSNGLNYQALTREGVTLMYARMPLAVREFAVVQIALSNGSGESWKVQPSDFYFESSDGRVLRGVPENAVIYNLFRKAGVDDVIKLQSAYEKAIYGNQHIRSNNGYEQRRQYAMAMGPTGLKAAAAASAIAFVETELKPGDSTDGAVFFDNQGKALGAGQFIARLGESVYVFRPQNPLESSVPGALAAPK
jgi:hypothetical protein